MGAYLKQGQVLKLVGFLFPSIPKYPHPHKFGIGGGGRGGDPEFVLTCFAPFSVEKAPNGSFAMSRNLSSAASGDPSIGPSQDMVLGHARRRSQFVRLVPYRGIGVQGGPFCFQSNAGLRRSVLGRSNYLV